MRAVENGICAKLFLNLSLQNRKPEYANRQTGICEQKPEYASGFKHGNHGNKVL